MEIRGKSQSAVPELYKTTPFITLDERQKNLRERREILELKTIMRSNAVKDLHIAKKAGIAKATDQFTQKNEMARAVSFFMGWLGDTRGGRVRDGKIDGVCLPELRLNRGDLAVLSCR